MSISNTEIAAMFDELADLLEIQGADTFRIRAYRTAARSIADNPKRMTDLLAAGQDLAELPGIGKAIAAKVQAIAASGKLPQLEQARRRTPEPMGRLMHVRGLGPKRVKALCDALRLHSLEDLQRALRAGRIRTLEGFGEKTERLIESGLQQLAERDKRLPLSAARQIAGPLLDYLRAVAGVRRVVVAGSYRRCRETVGDLDILVTSRKGSRVMQAFVAYEDVAEVLSQGKTRCTVVLRSGLQVDLRVVVDASYGAALVYFTGSRAHNIAIRRIAVRKGLKINEYGVFRGTRRVAAKSERDVYARIGLPYIEPELRENRGEIEAAAANALPRLITLAQIRGDLHCHTSASDGRQTLAELAAAARARGHQYVAVTDHSKRLSIAHGLDARRLRRQMAAIDRLNEKLDGIVVLKGAEVDILEDGSLDLPDDVLEALDITVCAIHHKFDLPRRKQTERVLRAMDHACFNVLAHPTGRLLGERAPYDIDLEQVMQAARERGCFLELNAQPSRMDLSAEYCKLAKDARVMLAISTDAHRETDLDLMELGTTQARRGWLERGDVINTRSLKSLQRLLRR